MKRLNKRGQGATWQLALAVLAILVLGLFIWILYAYISPVGEGAELLPGILTEYAESTCSLAASGSSLTAYCELKEFTIEGQKQFVNCEYVKGIYVVEYKWPAGGTPCLDKRTEILHCESLRRGTAPYDGDVIVNGKLCYSEDENDDDWGVAPEMICDGFATPCRNDALDSVAKCGEDKTKGQLGCKWDATVDSDPQVPGNEGACVADTEVTACKDLVEAQCGADKDSGQLGCEWKIKQA